jgi:hypothetical protein
LNSGLHTCKTGALQLEPHIQSVLLWLFWTQALANYLPRLILLISASQVAWITHVSHQHPDTTFILMENFPMTTQFILEASMIEKQQV